MSWKRILLIVAFIAVSLGIAYAIFVVFFLPPSVPVTNVNGAVNVNGGGLPTAGGGTGGPTGGGVVPLPGGGQGQAGAPSPVASGGVTTVTALGNVATVGASISTNGLVSYYDRNTNRFYHIGPDGTASQLSSKQFFDVSNAVFDPSGTKAIIEYPDGANVSYDFSTGTQVTLPAHWEDFGWDSTGKTIVAKSIGVDSNNRFLITAGADGTGARAVQELGDNADAVQVAVSPTAQVIATAATGQKIGVDRQEIFLIGQHGENFKSLLVDGLDFRPQWDPSGRQLLYSVAGSNNDWKPQLWIVNAQGDDIGSGRHSINLNTWADKCAFADDVTLYCGVPSDLPIGAGLNQAVANDRPDSIYRVNLTTGLTTQVAVPDGSHIIDKMMVAPDGSALYFTDKVSGLLNKVRLK